MLVLAAGAVFTLLRHWLTDCVVLCCSTLHCTDTRSGYAAGAATYFGAFVHPIYSSSRNVDGPRANEMCHFILGGIDAMRVTSFVDDMVCLGYVRNCMVMTKE